MFGFLRQRARDSFARDIMQAIARSGGPADYVYNREEFTLRRPGAVTHLANTYELWRRASGEQRSRIFQNFVAAQSAVEAPIPDFAEVEDKLVTVIRERALFANSENLNLAGPGEAERKNEAAYEACSAWFARAVVIDFPTHVAIISGEHLRRWNMTFDEVAAHGLQRLRDCTLPKFRSEGGYFVGTWDDDFDSSRVFLRSLFDDLPLKGEPVACIPNRLKLMVTGSEEPAAILAMMAKAEEIVRTVPKPQNASPLLITADGVQDFVARPGSPLQAEIERVARTTKEIYYAEQKDLLEARFAKEGKDIFVASVQAMTKDGGAPQLFAVWARGVTTLLPEADLVALVDSDKPGDQQVLGLVKWTRVQEVAGDFLLDAKLFPARFYVSKFPSEDELRKLFG